MDDKRALIAYYSLSGNTEKIAKQIQEEINADLFRIETVNSYPSEYNKVVEQAKKEKNENYHPDLKTQPENLEEYDIIFLGTPVWWYTAAPAIKTFLSKNNFKGKIIFPFCTHGGGGASSTYTDMEKLLPDSTVKKGLTVYENGNEKTKEEIKNWLNQ